jgi:hypothetical protein
MGMTSYLAESAVFPGLLSAGRTSDVTAAPPPAEAHDPAGTCSGPVEAPPDMWRGSNGSSRRSSRVASPFQAAVEDWRSPPARMSDAGVRGDRWTGVERLTNSSGVYGG